MSSSSISDTARRRSQRVMLSVRVTVSGETAAGPFSETTQTIVVNAHGALVGLAANLAKGQDLRIIRPTQPPLEQSAQVVWIGPSAGGTTQYGLEFTTPAPRFWGIFFPPADWSTVLPLEEPNSK